MSNAEENGENKSPTLEQGAPAATDMVESGRLSNGRFRAGTSGNAKGRPKKTERAWSHRQLSREILQEAYRLVPVQMNGKTEYVPMYVLMIQQLFLRAAKGNEKAFKIAHDLVDRTQSWQESKNRKFYELLESTELSAADDTMFGKTNSPMFGWLAASRRHSRKL